MKFIMRQIATLSLIGYFPLPGTVASFLTFLFVLIFGLTNDTVVKAALILFVIGIICAHSAEKSIGERDSRHIVIDEVVGYLASIMYIKHSFILLFIAFILFRFFDILKPPPINYADKGIDGGFGGYFKPLA